MYINYISATESTKNENIKTTFIYQNSEKATFSTQDKKEIQKVVQTTITKMYKLMPELAAKINFNIRLIDRDLTMVYGVTGRADKKDEIEISLSSTYQGGISQAIKDGLVGTVFHELHHTVRGWTMYDNKFPQGIDTASINEGLADVFAEIQIDRSMNRMSTNINFDVWVEEIKALPKNANYGDWMGLHPDGREAVGYRTGAYIVKRAMKNSGKDIIAMSKLSVEDIYILAGH
ncbi:MAG: DUF2268 domain-containing putative Zn-dependent protease [Thalassotalea sp.]|nr:DUF2268 domain-containing putative Zn-dependent protease [Thalassotalea sp.]